MDNIDTTKAEPKTMTMDTALIVYYVMSAKQWLEHAINVKNPSLIEFMHSKALGELNNAQKVIEKSIGEIVLEENENRE